MFIKENKPAAFLMDLKRSIAHRLTQVKHTCGVSCHVSIQHEAKWLNHDTKSCVLTKYL